MRGCRASSGPAATTCTCTRTAGTAVTTESRRITVESAHARRNNPRRPALDDHASTHQVPRELVLRDGLRNADRPAEPGRRGARAGAHRSHHAPSRPLDDRLRLPDPLSQLRPARVRGRTGGQGLRVGRSARAGREGGRGRRDLARRDRPADRRGRWLPVDRRRRDALRGPDAFRPRRVPRGRGRRPGAGQGRDQGGVRPAARPSVRQPAAGARGPDRGRRQGGPATFRRGLAVLAALAGLPPVPAHWPGHVGLGLTDSPGGAKALHRSIPKLDFRYQYLAGGVNTGEGWRTWNENGTFVDRYIGETEKNA